MVEEGIPRFIILPLIGAFVLAACASNSGQVVTPLPADPSSSLVTALPASPTSEFGIDSTWYRQADGMTMIFVPAGEFAMGTTADEALLECQKISTECFAGLYMYEEPTHIVRLDAYWIDKTEVTNAMYAKCVEAGECQPPTNTITTTYTSYYGDPQYDNFPIVNVSLSQAGDYCEWAGARLPSEAEWEKAARGTDERFFPWGNTAPNCSLSNYSGDCVGGTAEVGTYPAGASPYGALDMAGNVWEWVNDWWSETYYSQSPASNPLGPDSGTYRIMRGGGWRMGGNYVRTTSRSQFPDVGDDTLGIRCVLTETGTGPFTSDDNQPADIIFYNGSLITMEPVQPAAQAIAVRGSLIQAVGTDVQVLSLQGPDTILVDLQGRTLMPGFIDGHTHLLTFYGRMGQTLEGAQQVALSNGYTMVSEKWADDTVIENFFQAERDGSLRLRVNLFPIYNEGQWGADRSRVLVQAWYPANEPILDPERFVRIPGIKIFMDGDNARPERGCFAITDPYLPGAGPIIRGVCSSPTGDLYWEQDELNQIVSDAQAAGFRVAFHAMGDRAIATALNAIEYALDGRSNEIFRHQVDHDSLVSPEVLARFETVQAAASMRGHVELCDLSFLVTNYGIERKAWYVNRYSLPGLGIHAYLETDYGWTVDPAERFDQRTFNPFMALFGLTTHRYANAPGSTCAPDPVAAAYVIDRQTALKMLTLEGAWAVSMEDHVGSLKTGKFADLIILSGDPLTEESNDLIDMSVLMTMVGGKVEYCAEGQTGICPAGLSSPVEEAAERTAVMWEAGMFGDEGGLLLNQGGDTDTEPVSDGRRTGNGHSLSSYDGNSIRDYFMQFNVDDGTLYQGQPTTGVRIDLEYLDVGTDTFNIQYDGVSGGMLGDGSCLESETIVKTNSGIFKTATFTLNDVYFGNRMNGGDLRLNDFGDGPETFRTVTITLLPAGDITQP